MLDGAGEHEDEAVRAMDSGAVADPGEAEVPAVADVVSLEKILVR